MSPEPLLAVRPPSWLPTPWFWFVLAIDVSPVVGMESRVSSAHALRRAAFRLFARGDQCAHALAADLAAFLADGAIEAAAMRRRGGLATFAAEGRIPVGPQLLAPRLAAAAAC